MLKNLTEAHARQGPGDEGERFACNFEGLAGPIETTYRLGFVVEIAGFQLAQTLGNLVMFWLPKNSLKLRKKLAYKIN